MGCNCGSKKAQAAEAVQAQKTIEARRTSILREERAKAKARENAKK